MDAALHEVARRLIGRMPGQREYRVQPSTPTQAAAWAATASYMSARIQSASDEMMHVRGFEERAADMSDALPRSVTEPSRKPCGSRSHAT